MGASWWADFRFNGHRCRKRSPDNSKAGAQAYEALLRQKLARGEQIEVKQPTAQLTFAEFAPEWFETYVKSNCKHSEILTREGILRVHLVPWFGKLPLEKIQTLPIEQYKADRIKTGLSPKTINNHLAALSKSLHCAHEWGRMTTEPPKIKRLKANSHRIDFLSPIESHQLLQDRSDPTWNTAILLALRTGMRFGEIIGLEWSDVNWEQKLITVRQSLVRGVLGTPKNGKIRFIPMTEDVHDTLSDIRRVHGFVFPRTEGEWTHRVALNAIHRICKRTGVRKTSWHILRHTFASHLAMESVPIPVIQQLLGHASIVMTMRYAHLSPSKLNEAVAVFARLEKREMDKFGQQVGNALIKRSLSESPIIENVVKKMAQPIQKHTR